MVIGSGSLPVTAKLAPFDAPSVTVPPLVLVVAVRFALPPTVKALPAPAAETPVVEPVAEAEPVPAAAGAPTASEA